MKSTTISKNESSPKSQMSRRNLLNTDALLYSSNLFILLIITSLCLFTSCAKSNEEEDNSQLTGDTTPQEVIDIFDNFDVVEVDTNSIVGINGLTLSQLNDYLNSKYGKGLRAANSQIDYENLSPNDQLVVLTTYIVMNQLPFTFRSVYAKKYPNQPNGLAYVWGGKSDGLHPPHKDAACKTETLAGLDCTGLLYQGALKTGINKIAVGNVVEHAKPENWEKWLKGTKFTHIIVEKEKIASWNANDWKTGDIIIFDNETHIGTIAIADDKLIIIHSQGNPDLSCIDCKGPKRGPKAMTDEDESNWPIFTKQKIDFERLRFKLKNSYALSMRCVGNSNYLYTVNLSIDITKGGTFTDEVRFSDYTGSTVTQSITYSYDKATKEFLFGSTMISSEWPGGVRTDQFKIPLSSLGQAIVSHPSFSGDLYGCDAEFMLKEGFEYNSGSLLRSSKTPQDNNCSLFVSSK